MIRQRKWLVALLLQTSMMAWSQDITIKGKVVDNMNEPMIGVTITVDGHQQTGVITDFDGN